MCTVSAPKPQTPQDKPVQYLSNPWLDGAAIGNRASGRNSLRIDRAAPGTPPASGVQTPAPMPGAPAPGFPGIGVVLPTVPPGLLIGPQGPRQPLMRNRNA